MVARSPRGFESLTRQMRGHAADRRYLALAVGIVEPRQGTIDAPIGRSARRPDRMAVRASGRPARTSYEVRTWYHTPVAVTLLEAALDTGRTHQVRVHLAALRHPVVGDDRYGGALARPAALVSMLGAGRVFLHAWKLAVDHPDGRRLSWESPVPADLGAVLESLA
ncbi:MAG TPA: pseudouridine synthase [Acidimicrobiales bacterium]|nr:pseudouridine synthase [Acidimicrobiales bacterium]